MRRRDAILAGLLLGLACLGSGAVRADEAVPIEVDAGPVDRRATPVIVPLPDALKSARALALEPAEGGAAAAAQVVPGDRPSAAFVVRDLPAGSTRRYRLRAVDPSDADPSAEVVDDGRALTLRLAGRPAATYHTATVEPPPGVDPVYRRSGYFHPLRTPSGRAVTGDFEPDHVHQHGLFFAWTSTKFDGRALNFWDQQAKTARVRHVETLGTISGPVVAGFSARLRHEDVTGTEPVPVLDETWTVRAFAVEGVFLVDLESRQTCAGSRPLEIQKYIYGGLGVRGPSAWFDDRATGENPPDPARSGGSDFLTSEGKTRRDGNHTRPRWVDLSGQLDGAPAGLAVLGPPDNFRAPQPVRLHPNKPYFSVAPAVLGPFTIEPGTPYVSRYRIVLHDGPPDPATLDRLWRDLAEPPTVRVVEAE